MSGGPQEKHAESEGPVPSDPTRQQRREGRWIRHFQRAGEGGIRPLHGPQPPAGIAPPHPRAVIGVERDAQRPGAALGEPGDEPTRIGVSPILARGRGVPLPRPLPVAVPVGAHGRTGAEREAEPRAWDEALRHGLLGHRVEGKEGDHLGRREGGSWSRRAAPGWGV